MGILEIIRLILNRKKNERRYEDGLKPLPSFPKPNPVPSVPQVSPEEQLRAQGIEYTDKIEHAHPFLREKWPLLQQKFQAATNRQLFITSSWRSPDYQYKLWCKGRTTPGEPCWHDGKKRLVGTCEKHPFGLFVTNVDGHSRISQHNIYPSRAIDVCVDDDPSDAKHAVWDKSAYEPLGPIAKEFGLVWGGSWAAIQDYPHLEIPKEMS